MNSLKLLRKYNKYTELIKGYKAHETPILSGRE